MKRRDDDQLPTEISPARVSRKLTAAEFQKLADVPPEVEWFANLTNAHTRRAYRNAPTLERVLAIGARVSKLTYDRRRERNRSVVDLLSVKVDRCHMIALF
jgi:hypothetical protein